MRSGVSSVLDINLGWEFQWRRLDEIRGRYPEARSTIIVLRCPLDVSLDRIRQRHTANPSYYDPPEVFTQTPKVAGVWEYLASVDRLDVHWIDAARSLDEVYDDVRRQAM